MKHEKSIRVRINPWDRQRMVKFLEAQAQKGWMFCGIHEKKWNFRLIEPKKIHFSVAYFADFREDDYEAVLKLLEFREFCAHDGWELAGAYEELQIFYSLKENPTPIDTDPQIEIETMHTIALRKLKPELKRGLIMLAVYLLLGVAAYFADPVRSFLYPNVFLGLLAFGGLAVVNLIAMAERYVWYWRAGKYAAKYDEFPHTLKPTQFSRLTRTLLCITMAGILLQYVGVFLFAAGLALLLLILAVAAFLHKWIENELFGWVSNLLDAVLVLGAVALYIGSMSCAVEIAPDDSFLYAPLGSAWAQYEEVPPLTMEEYYGDGLEEQHYSSYVMETPFLAEYNVWMDAGWGGDRPDLDYTILEVKWDILYDACVREYKKESCYPVDATPWGAEQAYRCGSEIIPRPVWILCYEDRVIRFCASEEPTPEQMALVGQVLGNEQNFEN